MFCLVVAGTGQFSSGLYSLVHTIPSCFAMENVVQLQQEVLIRHVKVVPPSFGPFSSIWCLVNMTHVDKILCRR